MATDFTKSPKQILVDLINLTNNISLGYADLLIGPVSRITGANRNSAITITAVPGSGYYGSCDLTYDRVDFALVPNTRSTMFRSDTARLVSDLIPAINEIYKLNLQPEDYVDAILPEFNNTGSDRRSFLLVAKPESLVWLNSVELDLDSLKDDLGDILKVTNLSGFEYSLSNFLSTPILSGFDYGSSEFISENFLPGFEHSG